VSGRVSYFVLQESEECLSEHVRDIAPTPSVMDGNGDVPMNEMGELHARIQEYFIPREHRRVLAYYCFNLRSKTRLKMPPPNRLMLIGSGTCGAVPPDRERCLLNGPARRNPLFSRKVARESG
jgi:hypothetical protein